MYHSQIYKHCNTTANDQNCAILNAYFLFAAQEKQAAKRKIEANKKQLAECEQHISKAANSNFIIRRELDEKKKIRLLSIEHSQ